MLRRLVVTPILAFVLAIGGVVAAPSPVVAAPAAVTITLRASSQSTLDGERVYFDGHVKYSTGEPAVGVTVVARKRGPGASSDSTIRTVTTSGTGHFVFTDRPSVRTQYVAVVRGTSAVARTPSQRLTVQVATSGHRNLNVRTAQIGRFLGSATGPVTIIPGYAYQKFDRGIIIKVNRRAGARTWAVTGRMYQAWQGYGGLNGRLRHPVQDVQCDLLENGCIQRFAGGSLYYNRNTSKVFPLVGTGRWTELGVVAKSQVGYREPAWRQSKYNAWIGSNTAWCGVFQQWVATASGNPELLPRGAVFSSWAYRIRQTFPTPRSPRPGDLMFMNFGGGNTPSGATHVGLVARVNGNRLLVYEGNTSDGSLPGRRVVLKVRSASQAVFFARPSY